MKKIVSAICVYLMVISAVLSMTPAEVKAASPQLTAKQVMMTAGQKYTLKLKNAKKVKWSSSNKAVAAVKQGKITFGKNCNPLLYIGRKRYLREHAAYKEAGSRCLR